MFHITHPKNLVKTANIFELPSSVDWMEEMNAELDDEMSIFHFLYCRKLFYILWGGQIFLVF